MGFESPLGLRRKLKNKLRHTNLKKLNKSTVVEDEKTLNTTIEEDESMNINNISTTDRLLSTVEIKMLRKEVNNMKNLATIYFNSDNSKSRNCYLRALDAQSKVLNNHKMILSRKKQDLDSDKTVIRYIYELADINEKLGNVEMSLLQNAIRNTIDMNVIEEYKLNAIDRYKTAIEHHKSIPPTSYVDDSIMIDGISCEDSIERLKGLILKIDPAYANYFYTKQETIEESPSLESELHNDMNEAKETTADDINDDDTFHFSIKSDIQEESEDYDDTPVSFPEINEEDYHLGEIKFSESNYIESIEYFLASHAKSSENIIISCMLLERIAVCYGLLNDYTKAKKYYMDGIISLTKFTSNIIDDKESSIIGKILLFRIYLRLAKLYLDNDHPNDSIDCYVKAFPIYMETNQAMDDELVRLLYDCIFGHEIIAKKLHSKKNKKNEIKILLHYRVMYRLMEIYKSQGEVYDSYIRPFYFTTAKIIGNMYMEMKKLDLAYEFLNCFISNYLLHNDASTNNMRNEDKHDTKTMAIIYHNLAVLSEIKGDYEQALLFFFKSLERKRLLYKKPKEMKEKLCQTIIYMANVYEKLDDGEMALKLCKEAIGIFEIYIDTVVTKEGNITGTSSIKSSKPKVQYDSSDYNEYAPVYTSISYIHAKRNEIEDAISYMNQKIKLAHKFTNNIYTLDYDCKKDLAEGYHSMGLLHSFQEKYQDSIECYTKSYEIDKTLLEELEKQQHFKSNTIKILNKSIFHTLKNLSYVYDVTNQCNKALERYQDCLDYINDDDAFYEIYKVYIYNNIGVLLCKANEYTTAMEYFDNALKYEMSLTHGTSMSKHLNDNDILKLRTIDIDKNTKQVLHIALLNNVGNCLIEMNNKNNVIKAAMEYYSKASDIWSSNWYLRNMSSVLSTTSSLSNNTLFNVGIMYTKFYDYDNAIASFMKYLKIECHDSDDFFTKLESSDDIGGSMKESLEDTSSALNCIGNIYYRQGCYQDSIDYFSKSISVKKSRYGESSAEIVLILSNLGTAYYQAKQFDLALKNLQLAYKLYKEHVASHSDDDESRQPSCKKLALLLTKMGNVYTKQKKYDLALKTYQQASSIQKESLSVDDNHPDVLFIQHNITLIYAKNGHFEDALIRLKSIKNEYDEYYNQVLGTCQEQRLHYDLTLIKLNLDISGIQYRQKQSLGEAKKLCEASLSKLRKEFSHIIPENHFYVRQAEKTLEKIEGAQQWKLF